MKTLIPLAALLALTGCMNLGKPDGRIVGVTSSAIGINIGQSAADSIPHLQLGYTRISYNIVPTGSNIFAPAVLSSMALDNTLSHQQIDENFATGGATRDFNSSAPATISAQRKAGIAAKTNMPPAVTNQLPAGTIILPPAQPVVMP